MPSERDKASENPQPPQFSLRSLMIAAFVVPLAVGIYAGVCNEAILMILAPVVLWGGGFMMLVLACVCLSLPVIYLKQEIRRAVNERKNQ